MGSSWRGVALVTGVLTLALAGGGCAAPAPGEPDDGVEGAESAESAESAVTDPGRCAGVAVRDRRSLRVMTINVRHHADEPQRRFPLIADEIVRLGPDVVGMQEVLITFRQAEWLVDLIVARGGPRYHLSQHYKPGILGFLLGEGVAVLSRWPVVESRAVDLGARRVAQLARVELPSGARLDVLNTHLENGGGAAREAVRLDQAERAIRFADDNDACNVAVFTGDLNATPASSAVKRLVAAGFADTYEAVHGAASAPGGNTCPVVLREGAFDQRPEVRIDFVLRKRAGARTARPVASVVAFANHDAEGFYPSDHFGVMTTFDGEL